MSNTNTVTLAQLDKMTAAEVQAIPQDQIVTLIEALAAKAAIHKARDAKLYAEIDRRFSLRAIAQRRSENKDTGTVRFVEGEYTVIADLPKKIAWDQAVLRRAENVIKNEWGGDPAEFITTKLEVAESKFNAWPTPIKALFEAGRTVSGGKATYKFEQREAA